MVHAGMTEHVQQRTCRTGFFIRRAIHHRADPAVDHGAGAHDARFESDIERGVQQAVVLQHQSTLAQGHDFGMPITWLLWTSTAPTGTSPSSQARLASWSAWRIQYS